MLYVCFCMFKPSEEIIVRATYDLSPNTKYKSEKKWIACNGEALVSRQELQIYEYLLEQEGLHIIYEQGFEGHDHTAFPDFTIRNVDTDKTYIWEHFGMTNNENYLNRLPKKLEWFEKQGVKTVDRGGCLILTFYRKETFFQEVTKFVQLIKKN
mgnify:CR=1 FL=1